MNSEAELARDYVESVLAEVEGLLLAIMAAGVPMSAIQVSQPVVRHDRETGGSWLEIEVWLRGLAAADSGNKLQK